MDHPPSRHQALNRARIALKTGEWKQAVALLRAVTEEAEWAERDLAPAESAELHLTLATALWCGYEVTSALAHMKQAYSVFRESGAPARAAWAASGQAPARSPLPTPAAPPPLPG